MINSLLSSTSKSLREGWGGAQRKLKGEELAQKQCKKENKTTFFQFFCSSCFFTQRGAPRPPHWVTPTWPLRWQDSRGEHFRTPFSCSFPLHALVSTLKIWLTHSSENALENDRTKAATRHEGTIAAAILLSLVTPDSQGLPWWVVPSFCDTSNQPSVSKQCCMFCWLHVGKEGWQFPGGSAG